MRLPIKEIADRYILFADSDLGTAVALAQGTGLVPGVASIKQFGAVGDGVTNDAPAIQAAINALAGTGVAVLIPDSSTFLVGAPLNLPSGTIIIGSPGARLTGSITPANNPLNSIFVAQPGANVGASTTTSANNTVGGMTLSLTSVAGVVSGSILAVTVAANETFYFIVNGAPAGSVVTLDRPTLRSIPSGSTVQQVASIPQNILIDGRGMAFGGTRCRDIEMQGARHCQVTNTRHDTMASGMNAVISWDTGSYDCEASFMVADATGCTTVLGVFETEGAEDCGFRRCIARNNTSNNGFYIVEGLNNYLLECTANNCVTGAFIDWQGAVPSLGCDVIGGHYDGNLQQGLQLGVCQGTNAVGFTANYNGTVNVQVAAGALADNQISGTAIARGAAAGTTGINVASGAGTVYLMGLAVDGNRNGAIFSAPVVSTNLSAINCQDAIQLLAGSDGSTFEGVDASGATDAAWSSAVDCTVYGLRMKAPAVVPTNNTIIVSGGIMSLYGLYEQLGAYTSGAIGIAVSGGTLLVSGGEIQVNTNGKGLLLSGGTTKLSNVTIKPASGATSTTGVSQSAGTVMLNAGTDPSGCATPLSVTGGTIDVVPSGGVSLVGTTGGNTNVAYNPSLAPVQIATGILGSNATIQLFFGPTNSNAPGMTYALYNFCTGAATVTFAPAGCTGFAVGYLKRAVGYLSPSGTLDRVTPDT